MKEALKLGGLAAALGLATWLVLRILMPVKVPGDFPAVPDLRSASAPARDLLVSSDAEARKHPTSAEATGKLGIAYHANEYPGQAAAAYRIARRLAPRDPQWVYFQALLAGENGNQKEESDLLRETLRLSPDHVPALVKLGDGSFKREALDEAASYYQRAAKAAPKDSLPQATFGLARVAARRQDWPRAIDYAVALARDYPTVRPPLQLLQEAYEATGRTAPAAEVRSGLLSGKFTDVPPVPDPAIDRLTEASFSSTRLLKAAGLQSRFGFPERGIQIARRAAEANPADADIRYYIARTQIGFYGNKPDAVDDALMQLGEGLRLKPDDPAPLWSFTNDFFEQPKAPAAIDRLRALAAPYAGQGEAHFYLGLMAEGQGQPQEAMAQYQAALRHNPRDARAYNKLGLIWERAGRFDAAIASLRQAVELDPMNTVARFNLGVTLMQLERYEQGLSELRAVLDLHPRDAATHFCMGFGYFYTKRTDEAIAHFREGLRYKPDDAEGHFGLGSVLFARQKRGEAAAELREALRLRPDYPEARELLDRIEH